MESDSNSVEAQKKPRFGILRVLGDIKLPKDKTQRKILDNAELNKEKYEDLIEKLRLTEYWKYDKSIHDIQSSKKIDISAIIKPNPPNKYFGLVKDFNDPAYQEQLIKYEKDLSEANNINSLLVLFKAVKKEHKHKCYFCGFLDKKFIEIHHKNGDHENNTKENLVPACTLCHRQHHLLWLSQNNQAQLGSANLDFLPQVELNHIQRISIVLKNDPKYKDSMGIDGKLGAILRMLSSNFSKPINTSMIPEDIKEREWIAYQKTQKLRFASTGEYCELSIIETALDVLSNPHKYDTKTKKNCLEAYDSFINIDELRKAAAQKNQQGESGDDFLRNEQRSNIADYINKYKKDYEIHSEGKFMDDQSSFNIFELAMALHSVEYAHYEKFDPKNLYLIYNDNIFSDEQIEYYRSLEEFNADKWGFGDR